MRKKITAKEIARQLKAQSEVKKLHRKSAPAVEFGWKNNPPIPIPAILNDSVVSSSTLVLNSPRDDPATVSITPIEPTPTIKRSSRRSRVAIDAPSGIPTGQQSSHLNAPKSVKHLTDSKLNSALPRTNLSGMTTYLETLSTVPYQEIDDINDPLTCVNESKIALNIRPILQLTRKQENTNASSGINAHFNQSKIVNQDDEVSDKFDMDGSINGDLQSTINEYAPSLSPVPFLAADSHNSLASPCSTIAYPLLPDDARINDESLKLQSKPNPRITKAPGILASIPDNTNMKLFFSRVRTSPDRPLLLIGLSSVFSDIPFNSKDFTLDAGYYLMLTKHPFSIMLASSAHQTPSLKHRVMTYFIDHHSIYFSMSLQSNVMFAKEYTIDTSLLVEMLYDLGLIKDTFLYYKTNCMTMQTFANIKPALMLDDDSTILMSSFIIPTKHIQLIRGQVDSSVNNLFTVDITHMLHFLGVINEYRYGKVVITSTDKGSFIQEITITPALSKVVAGLIDKPVCSFISPLIQP